MSHFSTKTIYKDLTEIMFLDWWILFSTDTKLDLINLTVRRTLVLFLCLSWFLNYFTYFNPIPYGGGGLITPAV